jgi:hypothetical protein
VLQRTEQPEPEMGRLVAPAHAVTVPSYGELSEATHLVPSHIVHDEPTAGVALRKVHSPAFCVASPGPGSWPASAYQKPPFSVPRPPLITFDMRKEPYGPASGT